MTNLLSKSLVGLFFRLDGQRVIGIFQETTLLREEIELSIRHLCFTWKIKTKELTKKKPTTNAVVGFFYSF